MQEQTMVLVQLRRDDGKAWLWEEKEKNRFERGFADGDGMMEMQGWYFAW